MFQAHKLSINSDYSLTAFDTIAVEARTCAIVQCVHKQYRKESRNRKGHTLTQRSVTPHSQRFSAARRIPSNRVP